MGVIKAAMGDAVLTSLWVFALPFLGISSATVSNFLGVQSLLPVTLLITTFLSTINVLIFSLLGHVLGGASFNPSTTLAFYAAGLKPDVSLLSMAIRFPFQAAGGVAGAKTILQVMPSDHKHRLKGPFLRVDLHTGAIAEGVISFVFCFALLLIMLQGPRNMILKVWLLSVTTLTLVISGSGYTGPSMNPANAFGWAYVNNWHNSWELFYVYWICPFVGAILAAWIFKFVFPPAPIKQKKA
ncbi:aquaporin SIP1-1-like [Melia azedarach]|uniref:Aquaporin SIP1-1-like n=2 Tax=Melia azedarach TaxID=155640 RepID=A0ACC1Y9A9_MELAZ|nr:aquaporin SIP1-1-like [Melia azedarach]KAJ4720296.1 aquaporin SIP1-1-like [Melia azedarach]